MAARPHCAVSLVLIQGASTGVGLLGLQIAKLKGAGVVIGVVDTGISPESPAFADVPGLGRDPRRFAGACADGEGWSSDECTRKIVGARWFVEGFGADIARRGNFGGGGVKGRIASPADLNKYAKELYKKG